MRIAFFTDSFLPRRDGIVTSVINLARGLRDKGHYIYIYAPRPSRKKKYDFNLGKNINVKYITSAPASFIYPDFRITAPRFPITVHELKKLQIDVIHFHTQFSVGFEAILVAKSLKKPLVGTFHTLIADPQYLKHLGLDRVPKLGWYYNNFFYNCCDVITTPSEDSKNQLKENGIKKNIKVIPNPVDFDIFPKKSNTDSFRKKYNLSDKTVLFFGRLSMEKNVDKLIKAFSLLKKQISNVKLLLIGQRPLKTKKQLDKLILSLDLNKDIIFTGEIDHEKLLKSGLICSADIFATMSETETQGLTTLEAMACGLPIVAANAGGTPDMLKNGENGYLIKAGDHKAMAKKLIYLFENPKEIKNMGKKAKLISKNYSIKKITNKYEKLYLELIKN